MSSDICRILTFSSFVEVFFIKRNEPFAIASNVFFRYFADDQMKLMTQMKETIDNQRDQIRALKRDVQQKAVDVDAVSLRS